MSTLNFDPATLYYVIVGRGFSAVTNHKMLAQLGTRLGGRRVLHIGGPDPWGEYHPLPMGQWPVLLELPAFQRQPLPAARYACLPSADFAAATRKEWAALQASRPFDYVDAQVTAIRHISNLPIEYELDLDGGLPSVRASHIDICAGPGPAKAPGFKIDTPLRNEYDTGKRPGSWPRVISGERYLNRTTQQAPGGSRLCFIGGGPTGAWCVERAQALNHSIVWISDRDMNGAFVSSRRNDGLVAGRVLRKLKGGEHVIQGKLRPRDRNTIFGEFLEVTHLKEMPNGRVEVGLQIKPKRTARYVSRSRNLPVPLTEEFDQVIISIGQATEFHEPTSWAKMLKAILADAVKKKCEVIRDKEGRGVGLQSSDERVRLLGACALSHPRLRSEFITFGRSSNLYLQSLPEQARVRLGVTLAAVMIGEANQFWSSSPNRNLNTSGLRDLKTLLASLPKELDAAQNWFDMRGGRIPPFDRLEALGFLRIRTRY